MAPIAPCAGSFGVPSYRTPPPATARSDVVPLSHPTSFRLPEAHTDMHADAQVEGREPQGPPRMEL
jgi:hypothetical protein